MMKSKGMKWTGHVAILERRGMHVIFWGEKQNETD
jgi:hypothetical protein